ncbi:protein-L-isoaspartate O-methyltransferase [Streptomyces sp. NPDC059193]|uniref:protein-L-isoaspartate O-methyltransferase family protein n=1 Tax=Streptomyces sp. NPDC059193 TaxID=3346763 RepID=UPI0036CE2E71
MTTAARTWRELADELVTDLRAKGAVRTDAVADAIRSVPRHRFITGHYATGPHTTVDPAEPTTDLLALAYTDRGIMTHIPSDAAGGYSSASQPSIVAKMLEAAQLKPGMRVLEIGAGTGYNAVLIAYLTGAPVHTIDASEFVVSEARDSIARTGIPDVAVHAADGYQGHPAGGPYDLIIVTCGISGIPPAWLDQLAPGGSILAPLAHAGMHPLTRITPTTQHAVGRLVTAADFMTAVGPLYATATPSPSTLGQHLPHPAHVRPGAVPAPLDQRTAYVDLWMYLAGRRRELEGLDVQVTCASVQGTSDYTGCTVIADTDAAVYVQPGALHHTEGDAARGLADQVQQHVADWDRTGRPALADWTCTLTPAITHQPLLTPSCWSL